MSRKRFLRDFQAGANLEILLVCAVSSVLVIRLYLHLTGYPTVGGAALHIAHMLWGGLLMLVALIMLLASLGRGLRRPAAVIGGIGFGTFIDELGKFLTHDNDYFFQPTFAVMYVIFVAIYLSIRALVHRRAATAQDYLVNALQELEEVAVDDLDQEERKRAMAYLDHADLANPLVAQLKILLRDQRAVSPPQPRWWESTQRSLARLYRRVVLWNGFRSAVVAFFLLQLVLRVGVLLGPDGITSSLDRLPASLTGWDDLGSGGFSAVAQAVSTAAGALLIAIGVWRIRVDRLGAYQWFARSVLVTIFITQVFMFYERQLVAVGGLAFNLLVFVALRFLIEREEDERDASTPPSKR